MSFESIPARVQRNGRTLGSSPAYWVRRNGHWVSTDWATYARQIRQAARAMIALGLEPGMPVCILGFNRPEWVIFDLAAMTAGGVPAGIYTTSSAEEVKNIVGHSEARLVLVEDRSQWEKVQKYRSELPALHRVVMMEGEAAPDAGTLTWEAFLAAGDGVPESEVDARLASLKPDQLATLIYTSGTTGPPKGVMLSHNNLSWTADVALQLTGVTASECSISYLPLSHIAEQIFSIHGPAASGFQIYFAESMDRLKDNLAEVRPHIFFSVPRLWEKIHAALSARIESATGVKKVLAKWATSTARAANQYTMRGESPPPLLGLQHRLARKLVIGKILDAIGLSRARVCVTGAAPISSEILAFYAGIDIVIHEVYGQSEGSGPTSFNKTGAVRLGTVGQILPGGEARIAPDGEILYRGPNVFLGYYKDPAATAETLEDGWLHSGDIGTLDSENYLRITGRKKEILITSGGKNITPVNMENVLKEHELINEAVVVGDARKYLTVLVTLDPDAQKAWCGRHGVDLATSHEDPRLRAEIQAAIDGLNKTLARVETIKKFTVLPQNLTIEGGELTPTMKVKRRIVYQKYSAEIEAMYAGDSDRD